MGKRLLAAFEGPSAVLLVVEPMSFRQHFELLFDLGPGKGPLAALLVAGRLVSRQRV